MNQEPPTLAVCALPPELWPPGDSQPSQFSISLCMCRQNPARDRPVTPLHQGRSHTCMCSTDLGEEGEIFKVCIHHYRLYLSQFKYAEMIVWGRGLVRGSGSQWVWTFELLYCTCVSRNSVVPWDLYLTLTGNHLFLQHHTALCCVPPLSVFTS